MPGTGFTVPADCSMVQIESALDQMAREEPPNYSTLQRLVFAVRDRKGCAFPETIIDRIAELLTVEETRTYAALALGHIGPQAHRAVPLLEKALEDAEKDGMGFSTGVHASDAILEALDEIRNSPMDFRNSD